jgi:hypothetical protein
MRQLRIVLAIAACAAAATLAPTTASADKPSYGCAPAFNLGAVPVEQTALLPRSQAAIDAGLIDAAGIIAGASFYDKNGNGVICVQLGPQAEIWNRPFGQYLYNYVDDSSSAP